MSQQRSISSTSSQRPARWKPSAGPSSASRERVLELVAVVEDRLGRDDRLERRLRDPGDPAQRVRTCALLRSSWPRTRDPGSGSRRTPGSARTAPRRGAGPARAPRPRAPRRGCASPSSRARARGRRAARGGRRRRSRSAARRRCRRTRASRRRSSTTSSRWTGAATTERSRSHPRGGATPPAAVRRADRFRSRCRRGATAGRRASSSPVRR